MFINFFIEECDQVFLGTLNVANLIMITFEKREIELVNGEIENWYTLIMHFNEIGEYTLFESNNIERLQIVHSCFTSVLAGGETVFPFNDVSFIEPCHPPQGESMPEDKHSVDSTRRTLSDL